MSLTMKSDKISEGHLQESEWWALTVKSDKISEGHLQLQNGMSPNCEVW